jgi:hypothetical protein
VDLTHSSIEEISIEKYIVIKRWKVGHLKLIKIAGEFNTLDEAREYCCKQIFIKFDKELFDEDFKMTFWDRTKKIVFDII